MSLTSDALSYACRRTAWDQNQLCGMTRMSPGRISTFAAMSPRVTRSRSRTLYDFPPSAPREIDEVLYEHPAVSAAAVVGVPDQLYGEEVAGFVVLREGSVVSEEEILEFCKTRLADYKCPKTIRFVRDIPKGPTGKLLKRELGRE